MPQGFRPDSASPPHQVVMVAFADAQVLDIVGPLEVFSRATRWLSDTLGHAGPAYATQVVASAAGPLTMSQGVQLIAARAYADIDHCDTLLVGGGLGIAQPCQDQALLAWLRHMAPRVQRIGSVCNGALILAAAGLLDGRRVTTHWAYWDQLAGAATNCIVDRNAIFVQSGNLFTSAGVTSGLDLALEFVERDWGKTAALAVAQELVLYRKRPGGQAQFSRFLEAERRGDRLGQIQLWILDHLAEPLSLERLAVEAGMTPRTLSRHFKQDIGLSPAAYVARVRLEEARRRLESATVNLKELARVCGFADEQNLRRAFRHHLGVGPQAYRERFGG